MINLDTFYSSSQFKGTSGTKIGREGYVPQPQINESSYFLRGDGNWVDVTTKYDLLYTSVNINSAGWESVETSVRDTSATWNSVQTSVRNTSATWNSVYLTVSALSAAWEESAEILPTVTNYLSTNYVRMLSATVTDRLSANIIVSRRGIYADRTNESGFGDNTLTLAFLSGVYVRDNLSVLGTLCANIINSSGTAGIISDNDNEIGFGPNTLTLAYLSGVYIKEDIYVLDALSARYHGTSRDWGRSRRVVSSNFNAVAAAIYLVDTSTTAVIATLPASPQLGDTITFQDLSSTWRTNKLTLNRNSNMIQGLAEDMNCDISGITFDLTYVGGSFGWKVG